MRGTGRNAFSDCRSSSCRLLQLPDPLDYAAHVAIRRRKNVQQPRQLCLDGVGFLLQSYLLLALIITLGLQHNVLDGLRRQRVRLDGPQHFLFIAATSIRTAFEQLPFIR
jgi:hypothetical protein